MRRWFLVTCGYCDGEGGWLEIMRWSRPKWGDPTTGGDWVVCPECHGSGQLLDEKPGPEIDPDDR